MQSNIGIEKRIGLFPLRNEDSQILFEWINNKELVLLNASYKRVSIEEHTKWFKGIIQSNNTFISGIRMLETDVLIGTCQLKGIDSKTKSAELQIRIGDFKNMGKGFGSEAVQLLIEYGFNKLSLNRIFLTVFTTNERAIKSYLKCGFIKEGVLRESAHHENKFVDLLQMSILQKNYLISKSV